MNTNFIQYFIACRIPLRKQDCHTMPAQEEDSHTIPSAREAMGREVSTRTSLSPLSLSLQCSRSNADRAEDTCKQRSAHIYRCVRTHTQMYGDTRCVRTHMRSAHMHRFVRTHICVLIHIYRFVLTECKKIVGQLHTAFMNAQYHSIPHVEQGMVMPRDNYFFLRRSL